MASAAIAALGVVSSVASSKKQSDAINSAAQTQANAVDNATGINREQFNIAKQAIERNNEFARQAQKLGTASALDVNAQLAPAQIGAFQQGNIGAQQSLLSGLAQQQNALFGQPVDLSTLQAGSVNFDPTQFQAALPTQFGDLESQFLQRRDQDTAAANVRAEAIAQAQVANQQKMADDIRKAESFNLKDALTKPSLDPLKLGFDFGGLF